MKVNKFHNHQPKLTRPTDSFVVDLRVNSIFKPEVRQVILNKKKDEASAKKNFKRLFTKSPKIQAKKSKFNFLPSFAVSDKSFVDKNSTIVPTKFFSLFKKRDSLIFYKKSLTKRLRFNFKRHLNNSEFHHFVKTSAIRIKKIKRKASNKQGLNREEKKDHQAEYLLVWYRSVFAFVAALIFIILPFKILAYFKVLDFQNLKDRIIVQSYSAFDNLASASSDATKLDLAGAEANFEQAAANFSSAQKDLSQVDDWLLAFASFSKDPKIKLAASGKKFLAAGAAASSFGQHLSAAGDVMLGDNQEKSWGKLIDSFVEHGSLALDSVRLLKQQLDDIPEDSLPEEYRAQFNSFRQQTDLTVSALSTLLSSAKEIKNFLGVSHDKRYLLVFQNNSEMRGSGGFFGSYALVDIRDGQIKKMEVPSGGSYDTEAGMRSYIKAPKALQLVSPRWYFWDANWWPDWPTSAQALMWFYEKSDGPTVDGVISFTPDVLASLLEITGPIDLQADYGMTIDANNFWELIQTTVEKDNLIKTHPELMVNVPDSPENQPKKIIGDLMGIIVEKIPEVLSTENLPSLLLALESNLSAKNILLYFTDPDLENKISRYHLDGKMQDTKYDYLMVAHTNIAGQKTDRKMAEKIKHSIEIMADGSVIDNLTIYRTHTGLKNEILSGVRNVDWLRVYVPYGSLLLSADGFSQPDESYFEEPESDWIDYPLLAQTENRARTDIDSGTKIYTEVNKTVFANWVMTDPGETSVVHLRYRLPFKLNKSEVNNNDWLIGLDSILNKNTKERLPFSLLVQKQPGANGAQIELDLKMPLSWQPVWLYPKASTWQKQLPLNSDIIQAVLIEK
ncbi:MAG: DUF4012 domain-containing protein [Patescibacteria group bacterium]|nr:DUF4012 domain-containing protein [Patescibacteria group bacterium]